MPIEAEKPGLEKLILILTILEGLVVGFFLLQNPSMEKNAVFMGYSRARLFIIGAALSLILLTAGLLLMTHLRPGGFVKTMRSAQSYLNQQDRLFWVLLALAAGLMVMLTLAGVSATESLKRVDYGLGVSSQRLIPLYLWAALIAAQALVVLALRFPGQFLQAHQLKPEFLLPALAVTLGGAALVFHWVIYLMRYEFFQTIPNWFWGFNFRETPPKTWIILPLMAITVGTAAFVCKSRTPQRRVVNLLAIILLGYILQLGFGFVAGQGVESVRLKYINSWHSKYARYAAEERQFLPTIRSYEEEFAGTIFPGTKPPGVILVHMATQRLSGLFGAQPDYDSRYLALTRLIAWVYPALAMGVLLLLFRIARQVSGEKEAYLALLLLVTLPNMILVPLVLDQVLYPLLFTLGVLMAMAARGKQAPIQWGLLLGAYIYLVLFISFSLVPILPMMMMVIAIDHWMQPGPGIKRLLAPLKLGLGIAAGFAALYALFDLLLGYNMLLRYSNAIAQHIVVKEYAAGIKSLLNDLLLNNLELAVWIGFPVLLLLFSGFISSALNLVKRRLTRLDGLVLAFFVTYLVLNLFGQTHGEVGRLWIFMTPLIALFAGSQLAPLFKCERSRFYYFFFTAQLLTTLVVFLAHDFG